MGAKCNRWRKISSVLTRPRIEPTTLCTKFQHYRVAIKAGLYRKAVQVCYVPIPCDIQKRPVIQESENTGEIYVPLTRWGIQNGTFRRKCALLGPFEATNGSSRRNHYIFFALFCLRSCIYIIYTHRLVHLTQKVVYKSCKYRSRSAWNFVQ